MAEKVRINREIRASELRVIGADGANIGILATAEAVEKAEAAGLDLIEISPNAHPPVAKIMDYGKFQYEQKKKQKEARTRSHITETKTIQIKMGTGAHDLSLKAKRISEWLSEGHRVKLDLFLPGRYKYMELAFLKGRIDEFLKLVSTPYKVADNAKKSPKGLTVILEKQ